VRFTFTTEKQRYFGGIGRIHVNSTRDKASFAVTKMEELVGVIVPHFLRFPLQSAKAGDLILWEQCLVLISTKAPSEQKGLEKIVSFK
jgi:hypothetical protein